MQFNQTNNNTGSVRNAISFANIPSCDITFARTAPPRRYAVLKCSAELLSEFFVGGTSCARVTANKLPDDTKIVSVRFDAASQRVEFLLVSESFKPVEEGGLFPVLDQPQFTAFEHAADAREYDRTGKLPHQRQEEKT